MLLHQSLAGCVIGKGGSKIKELKDVSRNFFNYFLWRTKSALMALDESAARENRDPISTTSLSMTLIRLCTMLLRFMTFNVVQLRHGGALATNKLSFMSTAEWEKLCF